MEIINQNPYRILGVYSTSSKKDIVANQGRMKAFLKVGKTCEFPTDFPNLLAAVVRTEESVADANAKLTLPKEQLKYAQFWFAKATPFDDIAFNHLKVGNTEKAVEIWTKKECVSSLQNRIVCALIKKEYSEALSCAEKLYGGLSNGFVSLVLGDNATVAANELSHTFLDTLCEELDAKEILNAISNSEWREYVGAKSVQPLVDAIMSAIATAKQSKRKDPDARLKAGTKLMNDTKAQLSQLRGFLKPGDLQYQMVADKLGTEILQCGIDYYNDSEDDDAAFKAKTLQDYALSIVVGQMAKDRCKENVDILDKIISELPPREVMAEDKAIKNELRKFCNLPDKICHAVTLLNNTKPHLQAIKNKLGASDSYYLKVSTIVIGNALNNIIVEVNHKQSIQTSQKDINSAIRSAWKAIKIMDSFDMESNFKATRYNRNRRVLENMANKIADGSSSWKAALILNILCGITGFFYAILNSAANVELSEGFFVGLLIGAISWIFLLIDDSDGAGEGLSGCLANSGCIGVLILIPTFVLYLIYKAIKAGLNKLK